MALFGGFLAAAGLCISCVCRDDSPPRRTASSGSWSRQQHARKCQRRAAGRHLLFRPAVANPAVERGVNSETIHPSGEAIHPAASPDFSEASRGNRGLATPPSSRSRLGTRRLGTGARRPGNSRRSVDEAQAVAPVLPHRLAGLEQPHGEQFHKALGGNRAAHLAGPVVEASVPNRIPAPRCLPAST